MGILYISYDGLLEPLGQSQVLQYVRRLAGKHQITLVTYEKASDYVDARRLRLKEELRASGIRWTALRYHRRPTLAATSYDLAVGLTVCLWLALTRRIRVVHARSYVAAVLGLVLKRVMGTRFLFDMRGFWADEKVEGGVWPYGSFLYRLAKRFERLFLLEADAVVSLSRAGAGVIRNLPYLRDRSLSIEVVPTCANLELFRPLRRPELSAPFVLGCVGSVGLWYMLDEMLDCFKALKGLRADARLLVLNRDSHDHIRARVRAAGIAVEDLELKEVGFESVAAEMARMQAGLFLLRPVFSKLASCPTKLAEFLGCGVPCLVNAGVGDYAEILEDERVGVVLHDWTPAGKREAAGRLLELAADPATARHCVEMARGRFSLESGVEAYGRLYDRLAERRVRRSKVPC